MNIHCCNWITCAKIANAKVHCGSEVRTSAKQFPIAFWEGTLLPVLLRSKKWCYCTGSDWPVQQGSWASGLVQSFFRLVRFIALIECMPVWPWLDSVFSLYHYSWFNLFLNFGGLCNSLNCMQPLLSICKCTVFIWINSVSVSLHAYTISCMPNIISCYILLHTIQAEYERLIINATGYLIC